MLKDFFKLNGSFEEFDEERLSSQIKTSKHIVNVLFRPDALRDKKVEAIKFENVSFSKTLIGKCTFKKCVFEDCLFIGTIFNDVEFHKCVFKNCNFFKAKLSQVYGRPEQFKSAVTNKKYSNIAVHMFQQLRENYHSEAQREFKNEAEYYFSVWKRRLSVIDARREKLPRYKYLPSYFVSLVYEVTLGYGYRLRNLVLSTVVLVAIMVATNHFLAEHMFIEKEFPSIVKSIYFTVTTMATLGATGFPALNETGYAIVTINVLIGISLLTATLNSIFRKVIR